MIARPRFQRRSARGQIVVGRFAVLFARRLCRRHEPNERTTLEPDPTNKPWATRSGRRVPGRDRLRVSAIRNAPIRCRAPMLCDPRLA